MSAAAHTGTGGPPADPADPLPQRGRRTLTVLVGVGVLIGAVGGLYALIGRAGADPGSVGLAVLYAVLPAPALVGALLWLDGYEPEPRRYLVSAFAWGAVGAVGLVFATQWLIEQFGSMPSGKVSATYLAPLMEEPAKGLFLLLTLLRSRRVVDSVVDGIVYAGLVALGFAFTENVLYYTAAYMTASEVDIPGTVGATGTFVGRGVITPFMHPVFTTCFGIGLALGLLARSRIRRVAFPLLGLGAGMLGHGGWNAAAGSERLLLVLGAWGTMLVVLAGLVCVALVARRNEGRLLWDALTDMARRRHWLHLDEVPYLSRPGLRQRARSYAKRTADVPTMHAVRSYQRVATRTAFLYDGVMRGRAKANAVAMVDLMRTDMEALRTRIVLPPPVRIVKRLPRPFRRPVPVGWQYPPPPGRQQYPPPGWQYPPPGWQQPPPGWQRPAPASIAPPASYPPPMPRDRHPEA